MAASSAFRVRWVIDTGAWDPTSSEFQLVMVPLPQPERTQVCQYVQFEDQKHALLSRLLQRAVCSQLTGKCLSEITVCRTKGNKPFLAASDCRPDLAPNFNFNVSHEGSYTVLASESHLLVGVDVSAPHGLATKVTGLLADHLRQRFADVLHESEWRVVYSTANDEATVKRAFQTFWSLKEAYIKARGDGLKFSPLRRASFELFTSAEVDGLACPTHTAMLTLDGVRQDNWRFDITELPNGHIMSVALGPPSAAMDAVGAFKATFQDPELSTWNALTKPALAIMTVPEFLTQCVH